MRRCYCFVPVAALALLCLTACGGVDPGQVEALDSELQLAPTTVLEADLPGCTSEVLTAVRSVKVMRHPSNTGLVVVYASRQVGLCIDTMEGLVAAAPQGLPGVPTLFADEGSTALFQNGFVSGTSENPSGGDQSLAVAIVPTPDHLSTQGDYDPIPIIRTKRDE